MKSTFTSLWHSYVKVYECCDSVPGKRRLSLSLARLSCLIIVLLFNVWVHAQNCTSNDVRIVSAYLSGLNDAPINCGDANPFQNAELHLIVATNTQREGVSISANLNASNNKYSIANCFTGVELNNGANNNLVYAISLPAATCETSFTLTDVFVAWGTGNTDFCNGSSDPKDPATPSKCRFKEGEVITVDIKLDVDFTWQAGNCQQEGNSLSIDFTPAVTAQNVTYPLTYDWDFGDGNTIQTTDANGADPSASHIYSSAGTYEVILTVTDASATPVQKTAKHTIIVVACCNLTAPDVGSQVFCEADQKTVADLPDGGGSYRWYAGADPDVFDTPLDGTTPLASGSYYVSEVSGDCESARTEVQVTINATPSVTAPDNQTVCNGDQTTEITFSGNNSTSYTWTNDKTGIGLKADGKGDIAAFAATNNTNAPITATITVTPHNESGGLTCDGTQQSFTITVNPTATVNSLSNLTKCNGESVSKISFGSNVSGATFSWVSTADIGFGTSGSDFIPDFNATNNTTSDIVATITVTPTANDCEGTSSNFTITVHPTTLAPTVSSGSYCVGQTIPALSSFVTATGSVEWYANANSTTGSTAVPSAPNNQGPGTYTYYVTQTVNGCESERASFTITVGFCGGHVFPTQTTCSNYRDFIANPKGSSPAVELDKICYNVGTLKGKQTSVTNATPGVFFYYASVTVPKNSSASFEIDQINTCGFSKFLLIKDQIIVWNSSCVKVASGSEIKNQPGFASITIRNTDRNNDQTYVISVKYDTKSIIGNAAAATKPDCWYTFFTKQGSTVLSNTVGSILLTQNCKAVTSAHMQQEKPTSELISKLTVNAYPNPFASKVRFVLQSPVSGEGALELYNVLGQKLNTVFQGHIIAGHSQVIEYNVPAASQRALIYIFRVNGEQVSGKLLHSEE